MEDISRDQQNRDGADRDVGAQLLALPYIAEVANEHKEVKVEVYAGQKHKQRDDPFYGRIGVARDG